MTEIKGDTSVFIAVNIPSDLYDVHARRVVRLLEQAGYDAHAMNGAFVLKLAEDITQQLKDAEQADRLLSHAASRNREDTDA